MPGQYSKTVPSGRTASNESKRIQPWRRVGQGGNPKYKYVIMIFTVSNQMLEPQAAALLVLIQARGVHRARALPHQYVRFWRSFSTPPAGEPAKQGAHEQRGKRKVKAREKQFSLGGEARPSPARRASTNCETPPMYERGRRTVGNRARAPGLQPRDVRARPQPARAPNCTAPDREIHSRGGPIWRARG